ncbi:MAG: tripartite tricarboxylate transporter TctB family protein [Tistlia sp.]|uniref:tripartite tricarboxylate transporter TctB family protein n=1 Tax=Tistlia sp. TaxID=3057121 RepID=UPI0034A254AB
MKVNDAVAGTILIVFAAGVFYQTLGFPPMPGQNYGSKLFPQTIAVLMALSGLLLIVRGVKARHESPWLVAADWMRSPGHVANFLLLIALLLFYILAAKALGFIPTAFLLLAVLLTRLRGVRHLASSLAIAAVATVAMQQAFGQLLRVPLPWGILPPVQW